MTRKWLRRARVSSTVMVGLSGSTLLAGDGGINISAAVDMVGSFHAAGDVNSSPDKMEPRTVDFMVYGAIDPYFDGTLSMAAHREGGEALFEVHEAFISSDRLISSSRFRLGQFFLDIGRLGRFHQHEWAFISTPLVHQKLFGNEGLLDSGFEYSYLLPLPFYLDLTVGVSNGHTFGHAHDEGEKPKHPNYYGHLVGFFSLGEFDVQPGVSGLWRERADSRKEQYVGFELTGKLRGAKHLRWLTQSEIWQRTLKPEGAEEDVTLGGYSFLQYGFASGLAVGTRFDYVTVTSLKDALGDKVENWEQAVSPQVGFRPSEFSNLRLAYNFHTSKLPNKEELESQTLDLQVTYILGAHPAHAF